MGTTKQNLSRRNKQIKMNHKIQIKYKNRTNTMELGKHHAFQISYYFREIKKWVHINEDVDQIIPRLKGKLSQYPRNSGFYA